MDDSDDNVYECDDSAWNDKIEDMIYKTAMRKSMFDVELERYSKAKNIPTRTADEIKFEKFAKAAMEELVACGKADFLLLKNDKLRTWWQAEVKKDLEIKAKKEAAERKKMLKEQALSKLSDEEKEALGIKFK